MTYQPRRMETWDRYVNFTIISAQFDEVHKTIGGVIRRREGPVGVIEGELRPPLLVQSQENAKSGSGRPGAGPRPGAGNFNGTLIASPAEAPHMTLIEHPLSDVTSESLPASLARVMPNVTMVSFLSEMETENRQRHGYHLRTGAQTGMVDEPGRWVELSRGWESLTWGWDEDGARQPFEDAERLSAKQVWRRVDRALIFDYAKELGLEPERSLFGRDFARSVLVWPLPDDDARARIFLTSAYEKEAREAEEKGVPPHLPQPLDIADNDFERVASGIAAHTRWERAISAATHDLASSQATTPRGRERAQERFLDVLRQIDGEMRKSEHGFDIRQLCEHSDEHMRRLGKDTPAYAEFRRHYSWPPVVSFFLSLGHALIFMIMWLAASVWAIGLAIRLLVGAGIRKLLEVAPRK